MIKTEVRPCDDRDLESQVSCCLTSLITALILLALLAGSPVAAEPLRRECLTIEDLGGDSAPYVSDPEECAVATSPASTFKLPRALIALQTGVVAEPLAAMAWDGKEGGSPQIGSQISRLAPY